MGFMEGLGTVMGAMAAKAQEVQKYKVEYERMSDNDLKREYKRLKETGFWGGTEVSDRLNAVKMILKDRGYGS